MPDLRSYEREFQRAIIHLLVFNVIRDTIPGPEKKYQ